MLLSWNEFLVYELNIFTESPSDLSEIITWLHDIFPKATITENKNKEDEDHLNVNLELYHDETHKTDINLEIHIDNDDYYHIKVSGKSGEFFSPIKDVNKTWHNYIPIEYATISNININKIKNFLQTILNKYFM